MKLVSVFVDVEDPINPLADDAAFELANLFAELGLRGSFCITGEKCRALRARRREDVSKALAVHCLGLHTNTHSIHPTTMELLADTSFEAGCEAAYQAESPGFEAFTGLFGSRPAFWGGAGNTWAPEISDTLKRLAIPAYSYALTAMPAQAVHRFNGVVALPQSKSISEDDWADDVLAASACERVLTSIGTFPQPWIGLFVGHPTRFRYNRFWDVPYMQGRTPAAAEFSEPATDEQYARSKANLRRFLVSLAECATVVGVDEVLAMPWAYTAPSAEELHYFRTETAANLRKAVNWPIHRPGLDAEKIVTKTLALDHTLEVATLR